MNRFYDYLQDMRGLPDAAQVMQDIRTHSVSVEDRQAYIAAHSRATDKEIDRRARWVSISIPFLGGVSIDLGRAYRFLRGKS